MRSLVGLLTHIYNASHIKDRLIQQFVKAEKIHKFLYETISP